MRNPDVKKFYIPSTRIRVWYLSDRDGLPVDLSEASARVGSFHGICYLDPLEFLRVITEPSMESRVIRRYNAYYHGWCLAFGEHEATYEEDQDINWLYGEDRMGMVLVPALRKFLFRELLGRHDRIPELTLSEHAVKIRHLAHNLSDEPSKTGMRYFLEFVHGGTDFHMFLSSHFCYPAGTRIVTFAKKKPLGIMYKEMQPMKLNIE